VRKFRFSLETVLKVKRQVEELRQRELAQAQGERDKVLAHLALNERQLREAAEGRAQDRGSRVDLGAEAWFADRQTGLLRSQRHLRRDLQQKEEALEAARTRAVEAARERRVLEKLEESQLAAWQQKANAEEQGFMDELAQRAVYAMKLEAPTHAG